MASLRRKPIQRFMLFASAVVDRDYAPHEFRVPCAPVDASEPLPLNDSIRYNIASMVHGWPVDLDDAHFNLHNATWSRHAPACPIASAMSRLSMSWPGISKRLARSIS